MCCHAMQPTHKHVDTRLPPLQQAQAPPCCPRQRCLTPPPFAFARRPATPPSLLLLACTHNAAMRLSAHRAPLLRSCTPARHCCTPPLASLPSTRPRLALLASPHAAPPASTSGSSTSGSSTTPSSTTGTTSHGPQRVVATGGRATTTTPSSAHDSAHTLAALSLLLLTATPAAQAAAFEPTNPFAGEQANSLYVTLALFLMSVPGGWAHGRCCQC